MVNRIFIGPLTVSVIFFIIGPLLSGQAIAHCDGLDGPVVKAAQNALEMRNVNLVLIWVQKKDEGDIRKAFQKTIAVRKLSPQAKELADMYFFETLVRLHRAGEGAPYTGLKPAGRDLGPAVPVADEAVASGRIDSLMKLLQDNVRDGLRRHFHSVAATKPFKIDDVDKGRKYVNSYVRFIHYAEHVYRSAVMSAEGHYPESLKTESRN